LLPLRGSTIAHPALSESLCVLKVSGVTITADKATMSSAAIGLATAIALLQAAAPSQSASSATSSNRVWKTVEFVPANTKPQNPSSLLKSVPLRRFQPGKQIEVKACTRMPMVTVDSSVDSKIIVPRSPNAPKPPVRMVGEEMPVCANR
jgi:hypothetical protein